MSGAAERAGPADRLIEILDLFHEAVGDFYHHHLGDPHLRFDGGRRLAQVSYQIDGESKERSKWRASPHARTACR